MDYADEKGKTGPHPYLHGNFAPIDKVQPLTRCAYTGVIPAELAGGEYVRNGGNPVANGDLGREAHWFDGDGMLTGVAFRPDERGLIQPEFVNQYILTDVYLATKTTPQLRTPVVPSIATLVNPASSILTIMIKVFRTILLVILSHFPGSVQKINRITVANTSFLYHDGRALATCESGPPMRVNLPGLETVGFFDGDTVEGEPVEENLKGVSEEPFGGHGVLSWMREWTTGHPRVDPVTKELILFHSSFIPPFVNYSIIPSTQDAIAPQPRMVNAGVPGVHSPKMMHDFGVSAHHTVIMDLPLSLNPWNLAKGLPVVAYDPSSSSRFGVFPRWDPSQVRWFETNPCCIFHTANTWDEISPWDGSTVAVNMLACRLTTATMVYSAGDIAAPMPRPSSSFRYEPEEEQCRLYYYRFALAPPFTKANTITHQFALSAAPFEFPSLRDSAEMTAARYIYGCSISDRSFGAALGRTVKIDSLVKIDAQTLIARGAANPPTPVVGCVDTRTVAEILAADDPLDPIQVFKLPRGWYAQESQFVPREGGLSEDDGWLLVYVFDENQLDADGRAPEDATSELWIIDALTMRHVVARVHLPQRVPYGLHGKWFTAEDIEHQRPVETIRHLPALKAVQLENEKVEGQKGGDDHVIWWRSALFNTRLWLLDRIG